MLLPYQKRTQTIKREIGLMMKGNWQMSIVISSFERKYDKTNFIYPERTHIKSLHCLGLISESLPGQSVLRFHYLLSENLYIFTVSSININVSSVVEFLRWWVLKCKLFAMTMPCSKEIVVF